MTNDENDATDPKSLPDEKLQDVSGGGLISDDGTIALIKGKTEPSGDLETGKVDVQKHPLKQR